MRLRRLLLPAVLVATLVAGCGGDGSDPLAATTTSADAGERLTLRLGYFPNLTHATALVGVRKGMFAATLGSRIELRTSTFAAGPAAVEAIFAGALDAAYVGPNPAINAFVRSHGEAVRIVAGATAGGAALVVSPGIAGPEDLKDRTIATPQLGGTQDVALRWYLRDHGLSADVEGGGDVSIVPQDNAQTLETFRSGTIDGAWVPEPWATRLVQEGRGKVLVDERALWPAGRFVTTHLVVRSAFLKAHRDAVRRLLEGHAEATAYVGAHPAEAQSIANAAIAEITGKPLADQVVRAAWPTLTFTNDPVASSLRTAAAHAVAVGLLHDADLDGIYDLTLLDEVLRARHEPEVSAT